MALELVLRNSNFYTYRLYIPQVYPYGGFGTPPNIYHESIYWLESFVYRPEIDRYILTAYHSVANWPGWEIWGTVIHPETGVIESHTLLVGYAVSQAWTGNAYNGGLGKLYATYLQNLVEIVRDDLIPTAYQVANPILTPTQVSTLAGSTFGHALVPERSLLVVNSGQSRIEVWDISMAPSVCTRLYWHPFPESFAWGFGYENTENVWSLYSSDIWTPTTAPNQTLMKYNYYSNKVELITELQASGTADRDASIAFDTKRKKLGIVRIKADAADGAAVNAFEIYSPHPAMSKITVPVSLDVLTPGNTLRFRSHLIGTKGEGGALRKITASQVHIDGTLPRAEVYTGQSGSAEITYTTNTPAIVDTLTVQYDETKVIA